MPCQFTAGSSDSRPQSVTAQPHDEAVLLDLDSLDEEGDDAVLLEGEELVPDRLQAFDVREFPLDAQSAW